ncbi:hypothetical protein J1TS5_10350 [Paenibacillus macerans]|uniref:DarT ssDNA thymidine ADP-ribosyltransferase family protein n=1 Tax=Paenibacillus macerans TaxID=44252 RepID=UPI001B17B645|nr:DarT ssDNA thymidine ADP-ribosyltransferase family protein [Paenibacillus macerans]GIP08865.1 hypothetical protein J1TS5_10350 [Paenibacillus macerans]
MQKKTDADVFVEILEFIKNQPWIGNKKWWVNYLFHFTDIKNAVKILKDGALYSREKLLLDGGMKNENASPTIIDNTEDKWKKFVRFYFRPRTPTQYNNEGFRPIKERPLGGAHCPIPVFLVFKSLPILTLKESLFSYGSLAAHGAEAYSTSKEFRTMPFEFIYHEGYYDKYTQNHIKFNRHAEVLVPNSCSLDELHRIVCRSHAEKETFIKLLGEPLSKKWEKIIIVDTASKFFYSHWTYIDKAILNDKKITFYINKGNKVNGTFNYTLEIYDSSGKLYVSNNPVYSPTDNLNFDLINLEDPHSYTVKFSLDNDIAYTNSYDEFDDLPF